MSPHLPEEAHAGRQIIAAPPHILLTNYVMLELMRPHERPLDDAFKPIEGDDKKVVSALRKQNGAELEGQRTMRLDFAAEGGLVYGDLAAGREPRRDRRRLARRHPAEGGGVPRAGRVRGVPPCDARRRRLVHSLRLAPRASGIEAVTRDVLERMPRDPARVPAALREEIERLARRYGFLHSHIPFPDAAAGGWCGAGERGDGPSPS